MDNAQSVNVNTIKTSLSDANKLEVKNQKLREENARLRKSNHEHQIEILKLENKLKIMELEHENQVKIMKLEAENQMEVFQIKKNHIGTVERSFKSQHDTGDLNESKSVCYFTEQSLVDFVFVPKINKTSCLRSVARCGSEFSKSL